MTAPQTPFRMDSNTDKGVPLMLQAEHFGSGGTEFCSRTHFQKLISQCDFICENKKLRGRCRKGLKDPFVPRSIKIHTFPQSSMVW